MLNMHEVIVFKTVVREPPVLRGSSPGGPQAVSEVKALQKLYQTLNE
jgi:hypothetical protein